MVFRLSFGVSFFCSWFFVVSLYADLLSRGSLVSRPDLIPYISWWPMKCPAYTTGLPQLFRMKLSSEESYFLAAVFFYRKLKTAGCRFSFSDVLAQLCWLKRKVNSRVYLPFRENSCALLAAVWFLISAVMYFHYSASSPFQFISQP